MKISLHPLLFFFIGTTAQCGLNLLHIPLSLDCFLQFLIRLPPFHQTFPRPHFWFPNRQFFSGWGCQPHTQPPTYRIISHIYNPRRWVPILVAFYDMHGLRWDYSLILVTTWDSLHPLISYNL